MRPRALVLLAPCIGLLLVTASKLSATGSIRGWWGPPSHTARVSLLWTEPPIQPGAEDRHWVAYRDGPAGHEAGKVDVTSEAYRRLEVDDPLVVALVSGEVHARDSVLASNGNVAFDVVLLILEFAGVGIGLMWLFGAKQPSWIGPLLEPVPELTRLGPPPRLVRETDRDIWTAVAIPAWLPPVLRCLWIAFPVFWLACVVSFEAFDTKPAPLLVVLPISLMAGVVGVLVFPPRRWLALRRQGGVLTFVAERRERSVHLAEVRVIAGEYGLDLHSSSSPFVWTWLRVVGDDVDERIEMLPEDNRDCIGRLSALCAQTVALLPDGRFAAGGGLADEASRSRARALLLRRASTDAFLAIALAGVAFAAGLEQFRDPDPQSLGLVLAVALISLLQAVRAYRSARASREARLALGQRSSVATSA